MLTQARCTCVPLFFRGAHRRKKQSNRCDKGVSDLPIDTRSILYDHRELRKGVSPFSSHSAEEKEKECKQKV